MVVRLCYEIWINVLVDSFPLMGMCENINYFSWAWGCPCFKRNFVENSAELHSKQRYPLAQEKQFIFSHILINEKPSVNTFI